MKMRFLIIAACIVLLSLSAYAAKRETQGEGYTPISFKDLSHTIALMGGVDINEPGVADDYARLFYCGQYQAHYRNDVEWNKIRSLIVNRVLEKKDHMRTLFETYGVFRLGRYDVESQLFPFTEDTALRNVGSMDLYSKESYDSFCGSTKRLKYFPPYVTLNLSQPFTLSTFRIPSNQVEKMLARMDELKNVNREIYGRIRFRVTEATGLVYSRSRERIIGSQMKGEILSADFFLDSSMSEPVGATQLSR